VIALKDLWKQQRQQRQQEVVQRQQQVSDSLTQMQQERLANAAQFNNELKQFQLQLQQQTQKYLSHLSVERKQQAAVVVNSLREFASALQEQTHQFLELTRSDRQAKAEELFRSLSIFHAELITSVDALRHNLQVEIQNLRNEVQVVRANTHDYLTEIQQQRLRDRIELAESLAAYVKILSSKVNTYLTELSQIDQMRAQAIQEEFQQHQQARQTQAQATQEEFQQQYQARQTEMQVLFDDLGVFRGELRTYCSDLKAMVWGDGTGASASQSATAQVGVQSPKPQPRSTDNSPVPRNGVSNGLSAPSAASPAKPTSTPAPKAKLSSPSPTSSDASVPTPKLGVSSAHDNSASLPIGEPAALEPPPVLATPDTSIDTFAESVNESPSSTGTAVTTWGTASVAPARKDGPSVEHQIFEFLKSSQGARLTELETALDINRFQAVDALRSLIKKGKVTQRDRVYVIQEEGTQ